MDQVEEIKNKIDIVSLVGEYVKLTKAGKHYRGLCPFHSEKSPSFIVSPELQIYKCFGCGEAGDAYNFLQKQEGIDFVESLKILAKKANVELVSDFGKASSKDILLKIHESAAKFYSFMIEKDPKGKVAIDYLQKRGIENFDIKEFGLGFSPNDSSDLLTYLNTKKKFPKDKLEQSGIFVNANGRFFDRFRGRIVFPLSDTRGAIVGFSGRIIPSFDNGKLAKYINSPETPIYHKSSMLFGLDKAKPFIKSKNSVLIVEGEMDMISAWKAGAKNTVAIKGSALTDEQVRILSRFTTNMVLALDSDFAGNTAARRGINIAHKQGFSIKVVRFSDFKDPDEFARADSEGFLRAIDEAVDVWDFILGLIFDKYGTTGGENKGLISREIIPVLLGIEDEIVRSHYINLCAKRLSVSEESILSQMRKQSQTINSPNEKPEVFAKPKVDINKTRKELLEEEAFELCMATDAFRLLEEGVVDLFSDKRFVRILNLLSQYRQSHEEFSPQEFLKNVPPELSPIIQDSFLRAQEYDKKDINMVFRELEKENLKVLIDNLAHKMAVFEEKGENAKLMEAEEEFVSMTKKLRNLT